MSDFFPPSSDVPPAPPVPELGAAMYESSPDCVKLLGTDGCIESMNKNGQCAMEIDDIAPLIGRAWSSLWPQETAPLVVSALDAARSGGTGRFTAFCPTAKGTPRWWDVIVAPILGADGQLERILAISRDVTSARQAGQALEQSTERLQLATEAAELGLWTWDPVSDNVTWDNERTYDILGVCRSTAPVNSARFAAEFLHPDDVGRFAKAVAASVAGDLRFQFEGRVRDADGAVRWVELYGRPRDRDGEPSTLLVGTIADITTRKQSEEALFESRESLGKIVSQAATGVVQADVRGRITMVNQKFCDMLGYAEDELLAMTVADVTAPGSQAITAGVLDSIGQGGADEVVEKQYRRKDGSLLWANSSVNALRGADGKVQGLVAIVVDITERKLAEEKLIDADRRKDEFLAMLAHELRNPLAPIGAAAELLKLGKFDEARVRKTSEIISRQVSHMTHLVNDLLDVSRVTGGVVKLETAPLDLRDIVADAVEQSGPLIRGRGHQLAIHLPPYGTTVLGDAKRLVQIVGNLLNNAAKYTPDGGNIDLRIEMDDERVLLSVTDNGIGIEHQLACRVFDLFSQAEHTSDRTAGGLGLGLALVKSLVEMHGGTVSCYSAGTGAGSTFSVSLPRLGDGSGSAPAARGGEAPPAQARLLDILVVDDNVDAAAMLAMLLEASGHRLTVEHSARDALARIETARFDVCLLDIGLPEMDGNALAARLRLHPHTCDALLVAITGYGQESDRQRSQAAGFDQHMVKPVDTGKLMDVLAEVV